MRQHLLRSLLTMLLLFSSAALFAQGVVKGSVKDANGAAISGVSVTVANSSKGTLSDANGNFFLPLSNGTYQVMFSFVGFTPVTKPVTVQGADVNLDITMEAATSELTGLLVVGTRSLPRSVV